MTSRPLVPWMTSDPDVPTIVAFTPWQVAAAAGAGAAGPSATETVANVNVNAIKSTRMKSSPQVASLCRPRLRAPPGGDRHTCSTPSRPVALTRDRQLPASGADRPAGAVAQRRDVVVRRAGGLRGVGHQPEVARRGQAALVTVEDVEPGKLLAVQRLHPHPDLAVEPAVRA